MKKFIQRAFLFALLAASFTACEAVYETPATNANGEGSNDTTSTTDPPIVELPT